MASHYLQPRRHLQLRDFHHRTKMLLTEMERHHLFAVVKEFQSARHLDKFLRDLTYVLDTPTKLDLLKDIRHFIPASLAIQYDQLAPYDRMAHPLKMSTKSLGRYGGKNLPSVSMQSSPASVRHPLGMTDAPAGDLVPLKVITLVKDTDEQLGFSIRGGSEYGLGIFISDIEEYSAAEHAGLRMGDNVIEVNSVSFENIASSSAVKVLIGCSRLRILVRRVGKVPGFKSAKEKTSWFDVIQNRIVTGMLEEHGKFHSTAAIAHAEGHINRRINLTCRREGEYLGFNIRGGREYALGIYVSGVDPDGIAEQKGLKVGDQIIAVNGHSFEEATHMEAVEIMKSDKQLVMTVRDEGIYPIYKEIYAEYRWIDVVTGAVTKSRTTGHITSVPVTEHTPWTPPDTVNGFMTEQMSSFMGSDDIDTVNISDDDDNMFNESDSMELFDQRQQPNAAVQTDDYACIDTVLQPVKDDVIMQERHLDISGESKDAKPSIVTKSKSPKSTIAVRAMENETRRSHPELASLWENGRVCDSASSEKSPAVVKKTGRKPRTIRELIFGTKSKGTSGKSATEGAHRKPRSRKALSGINFRLGSSKDTDSSGIEEDSGISQGTETESTQQTDSARMEALKHSATQLLNSDEVSAVLRHIHTYKEAGDVDGLVSPLTAILDTSNKATLFDGIKMILSAKDIRHFDSLVARHLSSLSSGHRTSPAETEAIRTERRHDVSNELCRINRKCLLSPVDARNHGDLGTATDNPCYTRRNSKLYKAVIHDKVKGQLRSIKESAQGEASSKKPSDAKTRNGHETFQCNDLRKDCVSQDPNDVDNGPSSRLKNTCPAGGASNILQYQMTSVESPVHSSPLNDGIHLDLETVNSGTRGGIENGYIDDLGISPVYETIGVPKVQAVSLKETPPSDNGDSGTHNNADDCESLEDVNAALHYLDSLYTEGSTGFQSNDDMDNSVPGSPRSIDSDVTTFGRRSSATYDVTVADGQEASCDRESVVSDNDRCSPSDNMGSSLSDNKGCSPESGDNRVSSPHSVGGTEGDLRRHTPPVFVPPPPPSNSPPPEEQSGVEGETEGFHEEIQEDPIPETADMVMMPDIVIVEPSENVTHSGMQNGDISDTVGDMSPYQDSDHSPPSNDMMKDTVSRTLSHNDDDASLDECDCDTGSAGGQFAVPGHTDFLDNADPPVIVLLDKTHRSLGISISGGRDSRSQPQVKIQKVFPGGAADIEGTIQSDMTLLTVDGHSLDDVCHQEAVTIIRRSYMDKKNPILKLVLLKD